MSPSWIAALAVAAIAAAALLAGPDGEPEKDG